jgi:hypothetical protein
MKIVIFYIFLLVIVSKDFINLFNAYDNYCFETVCKPVSYSKSMIDSNTVQYLTEYKPDTTNRIPRHFKTHSFYKSNIVYNNIGDLPIFTDFNCSVITINRTLYPTESLTNCNLEMRATYNRFFIEIMVIYMLVILIVGHVIYLYKKVRGIQN